MELGVANYEDFYDANQSKQDESLLVKFYVKPRQDQAKSAELGRPIFVDTEYVDIRVPGSRDSVARPASEADKARFPRHYAAFKQRLEAPVDGTPLAEWPLASRSMVEELSYANIKTVEQLAAVPDSLCGQFMGMGTLKRQAQEWLEDSKDDAHVSKLTKRLEDAEQQVVARDHTIAQLTERLTALEARVAQAAAPSAPDAAPHSPEVDLHSPLDAESAPVAEDASAPPVAEPGADEAPPEVSETRRRRRRRRAQTEE